MKIKNIKKQISLIIVFLILLLPLTANTAKAAGAEPSAGIVATTYGALNVRNTASTSGAIIGKLPKGAYVTLIDNTGEWLKVEYENSKYGYVSASYISVVKGSFSSKVNVTYGNLNVRSGPGTSYTVLTTLPKGKNVVVLSSGNGWSRILYNGNQTGYVSSQYLGAKMTWPAPASTRINQYYAAGSHLGIDIGAVTRGVPGDGIVAAAGGKVVYSGWLNGYGYVVYVNSIYNGQLIQTRYAHLQAKSYLAPGDTIAAGNWIGAMGNTGTSSGVHLHFEVRIRKSDSDCLSNADSTPVDPISYLG